MWPDDEKRLRFPAQRAHERCAQQHLLSQWEAIALTTPLICGLEAETDAQLIGIALPSARGTEVALAEFSVLIIVIFIPLDTF